MKFILPFISSAKSLRILLGLSLGLFVFIWGLFYLDIVSKADNNIITIPTGSYPRAIAVNPVSNKFYVANHDSFPAYSTVSVIDDSNNVSATIPAGRQPYDIKVNPITNKIYVANVNSADVTVINGVDNSTTTILVGRLPKAIAVNPVTNKIYVANYSDNTVTVIDGSDNSTQTVPVGLGPSYIAANPVTNKIYVSNLGGHSVTVINGGDNSTKTLSVGFTTNPIEVNSATNKIYVANSLDNRVTVIDGNIDEITASVVTDEQPGFIAINDVTNTVYVANLVGRTITKIDGGDNSTTTISVGRTVGAISIDHATDKIFVSNNQDSSVSLMDGDGSLTGLIPTGSAPYLIAINPFTHRACVLNYYDSSVTVITPPVTPDNGFETGVVPLAANTTADPDPDFELSATSAMATGPSPGNLYFQMDTMGGTWTKAEVTNSTGATITAAATSPLLQNGVHTIYFFATDGSEGESVPIAANVNAYLFLVRAAPNVSIVGRVLTPNGAGLRNATVSFTDSNNQVRRAVTSSFGTYRFDDVRPGETYTLTASSRRYRFTPLSVDVADNITGLDFVGLE